MLKHLNRIPLIYLVIISALLAIFLYSQGASALTATLALGQLSLGCSAAQLAMDVLFVPLRPLMYALIILSIASSLAISRGGVGAKFIRVVSLFLFFAGIGAIVAVTGYFLFAGHDIFADRSVILDGNEASIAALPFTEKLYGVLTSPLMISIYGGVIFGRALKALDLGEQADRISDLFMSGFRQFLQVAIPLAVFGSITLALNTSNGVASLTDLIPLFFVYCGAMVFVWMIMVAITAYILKRDIGFVLRAVLPQAVVSFSTASSIATLPATKTACEQLGANGDESTLFYTIGATVNMVGSLMGITILGLYAMSAYGIDIGLVDAIIVALQSLIFSVSAAGVPAASVVLVQEILISHGVTAEYAIYVTGLIVTVDTLVLDRVRTTLNTQSDSMSTASGLHLYYKKPTVLDDSLPT